MTTHFTTEYVEKMFTYRRWSDEELAKYRPLREMAKELAMGVQRLVPEGPEKDLAIRALHDASMKVNLAISMHLEEI